MIVQLLRSGASGPEMLLMILLLLFAMTISFSAHEFAHAFVAYKLGDNTPYNMGRVTLNPAAHVDPVGAVLLLLVGFGWGKPVVYNPSNISRIKNRRLGCIMVSAAGVTANFIVALIASILEIVLIRVAGASVINGSGVGAVTAIFLVLEYVTTFSLSLLAFNLLPLPPLDGFNILQELLPFSVKYSDGYRKFLGFAPKIFIAIIIAEYALNINILGRLMALIELPFSMIIEFVCYGLSLILF